MSVEPAVRVRLFGQQAELMAAREISVPVTESALTATSLLKAIAEAYPDLQQSLPVSRLAVDHQYIDDTQVIDPSQEIALIGLISGG